MKTTHAQFAITAFLAILTTDVCGQFSMQGEFRPRTEIRTGTKDALALIDDASIVSTSQRTRLNLHYKTKDYTMKIAMQDVRAWGSASTLNNGGNNNFDLHEAWAEVKLKDKLFLKSGRQELVYDDQRILGSVGWAQQARSHDLNLLKYQGKVNFHLGIAYNSGNNIPGSYESMHFLWLQKDFSKIKMRALYLNRDGLLTMGSRMKTKIKGMALNMNFYSQSNGVETGSLFGLDGGHKLNDNFNSAFSYEMQTGDATGKLAFSPVFGTNHKFNGHMDYFHVGNHTNSVGLKDLAVSLRYRMKDLSFKGTFHKFEAYTDMPGLDGDLGSEIDLSIVYTFTKDVTFKLGHSIYMPTESMQSLIGGDINSPNNWSYLMLVIKPTFF